MEKTLSDKNEPDDVKHLFQSYHPPRVLDKKRKRPTSDTLLPSVKMENEPVRWDLWTKLPKTSFFFHVWIFYLVLVSPCPYLENG